MVKRRRSSKHPQANHKPKRSSSQFDKRARLATRNPQRKKTLSAKFPLVGSMASLVSSMAFMLDGRTAFRLSIIMAGMMLCDDRRVAAAWFATAGVQDDWDRFYDCLGSIGHNCGELALPLTTAILQKFDPGPGGHITVAGDDSPTQRFGKYVEGAGVHHHPTPGPADSKWMYGHNWVSLCFLAQHSMWGVIALPLRSLLYVRAVDIPELTEKYDWKFRTKLELAVELVSWFVRVVRQLGMTCQIWFVADGAYASREVIRPLLKQGVTVFSRLRRDANLHDLPVVPKSKQRGRPRIYGHNRISLRKRASHRDGWESITYNSRGKEVTRKVKSFLATSRVVGGVIRVVIIRFDDGGWAAYFCTDSSIETKAVLETVADRWAIEEHFHDVKEVWGAGQQQVRNVWSNIGCWHLNQWMYALVELTSWDSEKSQLTDRSSRRWDNPDRRPSHADRRRSIAKQMLEKQFLKCLPNSPDSHKFRQLVADLISLSA